MQALADDAGPASPMAFHVPMWARSALAPTNTLAGNPAAIRKAFDTGGKSVADGLRNWVHDLLHNGGWPSQVDSSGFEVGVNIAATPGSILYRSDLIELIQYSPQTSETYAVPLLFCPPWTARAATSSRLAVPPANSRLLAARIRDARPVTVQAGHDLQKPAVAAIVGRLVERFLKAEDGSIHATTLPPAG